MCPYGKRRAGFILGEGAGTLLLESLEHAADRGARIYAELVSASLTNDAEDSVVFTPNEREMVAAFQIALREAQITPPEVDYICSHAHSSILLDEKETRVIKAVFSDHAYQLQVSTIKAMRPFDGRGSRDAEHHSLSGTSGGNFAAYHQLRSQGPPMRSRLCSK